MKDDIEKIVEFRLGNSDRAYVMAVAAAELGDWNHVINRLYYAAFYSVSAYFAKKSVYIKTHNGTRIQFHRELVKTGIINLEYGELYDELFNKRQDSDYADFLIMTKERTEPLIEETFEMVKRIKEIIKEDI